MAGQLSYGHHIGRFLQLDGLGVDEAALLVQDDKRVRAALLAIDLLGVTVAREGESAKAGDDGERLGGAAIAEGERGGESQRGTELGTEG